MPTNYPGSNDIFDVPSSPTTTTLSSQGDSRRNHFQSHKDLGDAVVAVQSNAAPVAHDHSGTEARPTNKLSQANTHQSPDTDTSATALHHTLGSGQFQAAAGNHAHSLPSYGNWVSFTPTLSPDSGGNVNFGTGGSSVGRYLQIDKTLFLFYMFKWGSGPYNGGYGIVRTQLPSGFSVVSANYDQWLQAHLYTNSGSGPMDWQGQALCRSSVVTPQFPFGSSDGRLGWYQIATSQGGVGTGTPQIVNGYPEGGVLTIRGHIETT